MTASNQRFSPHSPEPQPGPPHEPVYCIVGETLCQVRVWTDEEWEQLVPSERPSPAEHVPGLGWVGAVLRRHN